MVKKKPSINYRLGKNIMIVLEGPDNCGKTTLANALSSALDLPVVHSEKPDFDNNGQLRLEWMARNPYTIYDRASCISEAVYGPICRNGSVYGREHWQILSRFLSHNPFIIFCECSKSRALQFNGREDMEGVHENAEALYDRYREVMVKVEKISSHTQAVVYKYNYEVDSPNNIVQLCKMYINSRLEIANIINQIGEL